MLCLHLRHVCIYICHAMPCYIYAMSSYAMLLDMSFNIMLHMPCYIYECHATNTNVLPNAVVSMNTSRATQTTKQPSTHASTPNTPHSPIPSYHTYTHTYMLQHHAHTPHILPHIPSYVLPSLPALKPCPCLLFRTHSPSYAIPSAVR
jgi:hypothetical protein